MRLRSWRASNHACPSPIQPRRSARATLSIAVPTGWPSQARPGLRAAACLPACPASARSGPRRHRHARRDRRPDARRRHAAHSSAGQRFARRSGRADRPRHERLGQESAACHSPGGANSARSQRGRLLARRTQQRRVGRARIGHQHVDRALADQALQARRRADGNLQALARRARYRQFHQQIDVASAQVVPGARTEEEDSRIRARHFGGCPPNGQSIMGGNVHAGSLYAATGGRAYCGASRIAPSRRMTSPVNVSLLTIACTTLA